jgi:putative phage-type endonuclease
MDIMIIEEQEDNLLESSSNSDINSTLSIEVMSVSNQNVEITEDDFEDVVLDIYNEIENYFENNILKLSTTSFYYDMYQTISQILYEEWTEFKLFDDEEYEDDVYDKHGLFEEIVEFVEQVGELYMDFSDIPMRTIYYDYKENDTNKDHITETLKRLQNIPQPTQRTPEWYQFRNNLLSASSISKIFGSEAQRNSLIYEKCSSAQTNKNASVNSSLHWGVKYEPVTVMVYEHMFHTKIAEFGCIQHPKYLYIGASPDGINVNPNSPRYGRMLEIKNIVNREITGVPKEEYWVQTQIQMETCDLDLCDFMETRFMEYTTWDDFYNDNREYRGIILYFIESDTKSPTINTPKYKYMPLTVNIDKDAIDEWIQNTREESKKEGLVLFQTIYWYLEEYSCVLIPRNRQWFSAALPFIDEFWKIIVKERVEGYEHRASKKKMNVVSDASSNSYIINNMKLNKSICLVKLDE